MITPPLREGSFAAVIAVLGIFFAGGIGLKIFARKKQENIPLARGLSRLAKPFFFFSILGFVLVWFRQLGAAVLSARFWLVLILIITAVWFSLVLKGLLRTYKADYERLRERRKYEEYLPKRKR